MSAKTEAAERVAEAAEGAYMASDYGHGAFVRMARLLLDEGLTEHEAEAILKSKHPRWADDSQGHGDGNRTNSAAFKRYFDAHKKRGFDWKEEGREMAAGTPSDLPYPEGAERRLATILSDGKVVGLVEVWATEEVEELQMAATAFASLSVAVDGLEFSQQEIDEFYA